MITRAALLGLALLALSGCQQEGEEDLPPVDYTSLAERPEVETIGVADLEAKMTTNEVVIIDVRTPWEYAEGRIPGALNFPLDHFDARALPFHRLNTRREIIFYDDNGERAAIAAGKLLELIAKPVRYLEGGTEAWVDTGHTLQAALPRDAQAQPEETTTPDIKPEVREAF